MKVLIVEDDYKARNELSQMLIESNFEVFLCEDGKQALEMINKVHPDYIVSDLNMPVIDGFKLASILKDSGNKIPLIVYTSTDNTRLETIALNLGITKFISSRNLKVVFSSVMDRLRDAFKGSDDAIGKLKTP